MEPLKNDSFGLLIAYLIPGFVILWSASEYSSTLRGWLASSSSESPTVGGFLYVTLASVAAGMTVSTLRWLIIDQIHHATSVVRPDWNFATLRNRYAAFVLLNEQLYRYYQFYANSALALIAVLILRFAGNLANWIDVSIALVAALFFLGSRDTLKKYYSRVSQLLRE